VINKVGKVRLTLTTAKIAKTRLKKQTNIDFEKTNLYHPSIRDQHQSMPVKPEIDKQD